MTIGDRWRHSDSFSDTSWSHIRTFADQFFPASTSEFETLLQLYDLESLQVANNVYSSSIP